jgi:GT2 family glycosyltransferase
MTHRIGGPASVSVVTPTLSRPMEVVDLLANLRGQTVLPYEVVLIDGAPVTETETEERVAAVRDSLPFNCLYIRHGGGTAIQRNVGIEAATGMYVCFIDDDIRLDPDFFEKLLDVMAKDEAGRVGGITGYIRNQHLDPLTSARWRWYRRLRLFTIYEPGRYDFGSGYPINRYLQPPHEGVREIDFMGAGCALWRRQVFANGLRFSEFFSDYGVLEDTHFALRAHREWTLLECGSARCEHLRSPHGRVNRRRLAWKSAVNYRFVFVDIVPQRTLAQEYRFWRIQVVGLIQEVIHAARSGGRDEWLGALGKLEGIIAAGRIKNGAAVRVGPR